MKETAGLVGGVFASKEYCWEIRCSGTRFLIEQLLHLDIIDNKLNKEGEVRLTKICALR